MLQFRAFMYLYLRIRIMCWSHIEGRNSHCGTTNPFWSQLNVSILRTVILRCNKHVTPSVRYLCLHIFMCALHFAGRYIKAPSICVTSKMWYTLPGMFCISLHKIIIYAIDRNNCVTSYHNCGYIFQPIIWSSSAHSCIYNQNYNCKICSFGFKCTSGRNMTT
jgi:hypothetical protein